MEVGLLVLNCYVEFELAHDAFYIDYVWDCKYHSFLQAGSCKKWVKVQSSTSAPATANILLWVGYKRSKNAAAAEHPPPPLSI